MQSLVYLLAFTFFLTFIQLGAIPISYSLRKSVINIKDVTFDDNHHHHCNETCGSFQVPFPFYVKNASCGWSEFPFSDSFQLSCLNSTSLFLNIDSQNYRVLEFFSDGVLVDFPGFSNSCRPYNDLNAFGFGGNECFGISSDNVLGLYDCEDSFLCKANCEANDLPGCDRSKNIGNGPACCYPLSDHSVWHEGDGFDVFSKYECRGFSSWVVPRGMSSGKRGVKLEWGLSVHENNSKHVCHVDAHSVNASAVRHGIRCVCDAGFVGDGYANGSGCLKSCFKDGKQKFNEDCESKKESTRKKKIILTGVLLSVFVIICLVFLLCMMKRSVKPAAYKPSFHTTLSFRKSCNTRVFTLHELEEATKGFSAAQMLTTTGGTIFTGTLKDGSHIAVQRVQCDSERDLMHVLTRIELLSTILHRHLANILGCCIESGYTPMVVYEFPQNQTLKNQLSDQTNEETKKIGLDWYRRLSIAAQTSSVLAFLQHEITPPVFHQDLNTNSIFLDEEYNVKLACFGLLGSSSLYRSDVYDFGLVLLEIISGSELADLAVALQKIRDGKLEEILDPLLYYHEQPPFRREQIEVVADLATRCLIFGGSGKLGMVDVARELVHIIKDSIDGGSKRGPALEETFSNSSLLQMISMSPDSIYVH